MARTMARGYRAVCAGVMTGGGTIDAGIGRHRSDRLRMAVRGDGRSAITHYRILERYRAHTLVEVRLETGRTHQIRLHLSHLHYPVVGDPVYGGRFARPRGAPDELVAVLRSFARQALHAASLEFDHPRTGKRRAFTSPLPADFQALIDALRSDAAAAAQSP
jgi:23S rRNA pseudouridine1911/1915/1917 synthase